MSSETRLTTVTPQAWIVAADLHDWQQIAHDWVSNLKSERTKRAYREAWIDFVKFAQVTPDQVTQSHVGAYRAMLKSATSPTTGRPYSQSTINQRLSALSSFYTYAMKRGICTENPAEGGPQGVQRESVEQYGKATWLSVSDGEHLAFIDAIDDSTNQGKRDQAIMLLILTGGFRVSELTGLRLCDYRTQGRRSFLSYTRKGGITSEVRITPEAAAAIDTYLASRQGLTDNSPLFVATTKGRAAAARLGHDAGEKHLTDRAIRSLVKTYANRVLGKGHRIHPHSLRHTAAQIADAQGQSFTEISRLLKHKNTQVTSIYLHAVSGADDRLAETMGSCFSQRPAANE